MDEVKEQVQENMKAKNIKIPTQTLPDAPPKPTDCDCDKCESVKLQLTGGKISKNTVMMILRSNVTSVALQFQLMRKSKEERRGCINKHGNCKARFPDRLLEKTEVDPKTGALISKKVKKWINTLTPIVNPTKM